MNVKKVQLISGVILVILVNSASGYYFVYKPEMARRAAIAQAKADEDAAKGRADAEALRLAAEAETQAKAEAERQRKLRLATIGQGEGVINAYARQLKDEPELVAGLKVKIGKEWYDLTYKGDKANTVALEKWANHKAYLLAIVSGYVEYKKGRKHKRQIKIKKPGEVAYLVVPKQKDRVRLLDIDIYQKEADEAEFGQPVKFIDDIGSAGYKITFRSESLASFEYIWTPKVHKKSHKKQK